MIFSMRVAVFRGASSAIAILRSSNNLSPSFRRLAAIGSLQIAHAKKTPSNSAPKHALRLFLTTLLSSMRGNRECHSSFSLHACLTLICPTFSWSGEVGVEPLLSSWKRGCTTLMQSPRVSIFSLKNQRMSSSVLTCCGIQPRRTPATCFRNAARPFRVTGLCGGLAAPSSSAAERSISSAIAIIP